MKRNRKHFANVPTGFEKWGGYMEAKQQKLRDQYQSKAVNENESAISSIFEGVAIFVNGYTVPSCEELKRLMMLHSGLYNDYYKKSKTTHIIATNLPRVKIQKLTDEKIVKPEWIVDSIKAGKLLQCTSYMLYSPGVVEGQQKLIFNSKTAINEESDFDSESTSHSLHLELSDSTEKETDNTIAVVESVKCRLNIPAEDNSNRTSFNSFKRVAKAGEPNFLSGYYNHSRLHHISTSGAEFKEYVKELQLKEDWQFIGKESFLEWKMKNCLSSNDDYQKRYNTSVIMHIDMDCFFVSVGLLKRPDLIGKPVAITHSRGNKSSNRSGTNIQYEWNHYQKRRQNKMKDRLGVVEEDEDERDKTEDRESENEESEIVDDFGSKAELASCSYEARQFGVRNGMWLGQAFKLCPKLELMPFDFEGYSAVSRILYDTIASCTLDIEAISCDELFLDCTELLRETDSNPVEFASFLRQDIFNKTGCTASAGIGSNILLARLATKRAKPNGQFHLTNDREEDFMKTQLIKDLPGVGNSTQAKLETLKLKCNNCEELQKISLAILQKEFGPKTGKTLFDHCRGKDMRKIQTIKERKSVSAEINYGMRFEKFEEAENFLKEISLEVQKRLKNINKSGKQITLKLKIRCKDAPIETVKFMGHGACDNSARSITLRFATDSGEVIGKECVNLLRQLNVPPQDIRGMGIQVGKLENQSNSETFKNKSILQFIKIGPNEVSKNVNNVFKIDKKISPKKASTPKPSSPKPSTSFAMIDDRTTIGDYFPSPSEIDSSVWAELPKDIQEQLSVMYANDSKPPSEKNKQECKRNEELPNISQLDMSVLDELPDDIRHEVLEAYSKPKTKLKLTSPGRKMSPGKKISPAKRMRKTKSKIINTKKQLFEPIKSIESPKKESKIENNIKTVKANLCGAFNLEEQKKLIEEWIRYSEPLPDDLEMFLNFMSSLLKEKNLERLDLIIKYLFSRIRETNNNSNWIEAYRYLIDNIQPLMVEKYDHILKVSSF